MRKSAPIAAILLIVAILAYGLANLFLIRFSQGDIYHEYSSLRTDGLGTKALYESFAEVLPVRRNLTELHRLEPRPGDTFLFVGVPFQFRWDSDTGDMERLAQQGGRVVITLLPLASSKYTMDEWKQREEDEKKKQEEFEKKIGGKKDEADKKPAEKKAGDNKGGGGDKEKDKEKDKGKNADEEPVYNIDKRWGMKTEFFKTAPVHALSGFAGLEPQVSWHSCVWFDKLDPAWKVLYVALDKPVVIERSFGRGSIVLVADSYLFSNEALSMERAPGLLAAVAGHPREVIFDETHLGMREEPGVASLVKKYRLHGVVIALMIVAALFVWRNALSFVPPYGPASGQAGVVRGADAAAAFVALLKRSIPPRDLIATCLAQWKHSFAQRAKPALLARVEAAAADGPRRPVQTFQTITQIINEKK